MTDAATHMYERLEFDSNLFRIGVWRTGHVGKWAPAGCTYLLIDSNDTQQIQQAEQHGYRTMDIRVTLDAKTQPGSVGHAQEATGEDSGPLAALAAVAYRGQTRFYADPQLPDTLCDQLYETWLRNNLADPDVTVLVIHRHDQPVGYLTMCADETGASIGLVAVDERDRGTGVGRELVLAAVDLAYQRGHQRIRVVTQARNSGALRLYENCGFRVREMSVWLHRHG